MASSKDPVTPPDGAYRDLGGEAIVTGDYSAVTVDNVDESTVNDIVLLYCFRLSLFALKFRSRWCCCC